MSPSKISTIKWDEFYNTINGENRTSKDQHHGVNPSTGETLWPVPIGTEQDVEEAVKAASKAFELWRKTPLETRKELLTKYRDVLLQHSDEMSSLLSQESGKPTISADTETKTSINDWFNHHNTLTIPEDRVEDHEKTIVTTYMPLGVVGAICPWNFPITLCIGKIIPALLTGNTIIVKPSPFTPYTTLKMVELAQGIFPPGVVQAIGGDDNLGPWLTAHPDIAKISFTGSIGTGKKIMAACAKTLKRVTLELGGNDASIVCPDVDVKKVAPELVLGAFQNSGQVCVATKRIFIHKDIYEEVLEEMVKFTKTLTVGAPSEGAKMGPVQNKMQYDKVLEYFKDTRDSGYKFAVGGDEIQTGKGYFIKPTIVDNPPHNSRIVQEEPFGPIVPTQPWEDEEEVIRRANGSNVGLGACVWSKDLTRAERIARQLEAGSVFVNSWEKPTPQAFFGGHKESGIGGEWGQDGIKAYLNATVLHIYKS